MQHFDDLITANTLVDYPRLEILDMYAQRCAIRISGDFAEVGVYKGGTARLLSKHANNHLFLFDTFEGMPEVTGHDLHKKGDFADTSIRQVSSLMVMDSYSIYKGVFPEQNTEYVNFRRFSLVHLDVDIYTSVKECLSFFHLRMHPGGVIILDDYLEPNCPGAKLAADEFYKNSFQKIVPTTQSQAVIQY